MKLFYILTLAIGLSVGAFGQDYNNAVYMSHSINSDNSIDIYYHLYKSGSVALYVSTDGGSTFNGPLAKLSGDVGCDVHQGYDKHIKWEAPANYNQIPKHLLKFKVKVRTLSDLSLPLVFVRGGTFTMGNTEHADNNIISDEVPTHTVTLSDFYISQYEITQDIWVTIMGSNPSFFLGDSLPVDNISLNEARQFAFKLSQMTGFTYRLPTESEWEYAAKGGFKSQNYKYPGGDNIEEVGWTKSNSQKTTHQVGLKKPNELGIYDMCGNVYEWCSDIYGEYPTEDVINPTGVTDNKVTIFRGNAWITITGGTVYHVIRGGSWTNSNHNCYTTKRDNKSTNHKRYNFGVRLVREK